MPKVKGVVVDKELAKAVFYDDILDQLEKELESDTISMKSLLSMFAMVLPAMIGILVSMWANLQIAILTYFGNYTMGDIITWTVGYYLGFTLGPIMSIVMYLLVAHWASSSFQGYVVIRVVGRNASGSRTVVLDYMGEMPKPMRKPRLEELGNRFSAYMKEEITKLHVGVPEEEVQAGLERMQQRFAEAYYKMLERMEGADLKTVTRKMLVVKKSSEGATVYDSVTGQPAFEEISVQVPVLSAKRSRKYRIGWAIVVLFMLSMTLFVANFLALNLFQFNLFRFIFGWLPIWG